MAAEIITVEHRRRWSDDDKRQIVGGTGARRERPCGRSCTAFIRARYSHDAGGLEMAHSSGKSRVVLPIVI